MTFPKKLTFKIPRNSFVTKLFATYLVLMMLPLSLILIINYYRSAQISEEQAIYSNEKVISQTSDFLSYKVFSLKNIIDIISFDENVQTVLKTSDSFYRNNKGYWTIQTEDIKNIIYNSYTTSDITTVRLYMRKGPASFEETDNFKRLSNAEQSDWYTRIENSPLLDTVWIPSYFFDPGCPSPYISIVKRIPDLNSINKYIGVITGTVPQSVFEEIIAKMTTTKNTTVALYNSHNEMITATGDSALTEVNFLNGIIAENKLPADGTMHKVNISKNDYLIGVHNIDHADWKLVMLVPNGDILTSAYLYRNQLFWIVLILFLFSIPIIYITSYSITSRLRRLKHHMKEAGSKNFIIAPLKNGEDEIGELTDSFNNMAGKISGLLDEQYRLGYEIKNLELKVLQSLINPHFLYNTLDMIYWLAVKNKVPAIENAAKSLGRFYKLSLGHGEDIVTLEKELTHVRTYVNIQNMRFEDKINLVVDVPDELSSCRIIKIVLQPLVENAILHGIYEKADSRGTITIKGQASGGTLQITIEDDGVGMSSEQLSALLATPGENKGYGVWNINERIRLTYGEPYGLRFTSTPDEGTCVFVTFPLEK